MSDHELLTECLDVLTHDAAQRTFAGGVRMSQLAIKLRAHLAAPCLEVTVDPRLTPDEAAAISSALAAPQPEPVAKACWACNGKGFLRDIDTAGLLPCVVCKSKEVQP